MDITLLIARLGLSTVFAYAALAKFVGQAQTRRMLIDFGLPPWLMTWAGVLLPASELLVALALVPAATAWWGAVAAVCLLVLFITALVVNLVLGRRPECHCFGQVAAGPVSRWTVARNAAFLAVGMLVVASGRDATWLSPFGWLNLLTTGERFLLAASMVVSGLVALQAYLLVQVVAQNGRLLTRIDEQEALINSAAGRPSNGHGPSAPATHTFSTHGGSTAPATSGSHVVAPNFTRQDIHGNTVSLHAYRGRRVLLVFSDPQCGACDELAPVLAKLHQELEVHQIAMLMAALGDPAQNRRKAAQHGIEFPVLINVAQMADEFGVTGTPTGLLIEANGMIAQPMAMGGEAILTLAQHALQVGVR